MANAVRAPHGVFLDIDGTVCDNNHFFYQAMCQICEKYEHPAPSYTEFILARDYPFTKSFEILGPKVRHAQLEEEFFGYVNHLKKKEEMMLFPNVSDIIKTLYRKKICVGIISGNTVENILAILEPRNLTPYVEFIDHDCKDKSIEIKKRCSEFDLSRSRVFYVGDICEDMRAAHRACVIGVGVDGGIKEQRKKLYQAGADHCIAHCGNLPEILPDTKTYGISA